MLTTPSLTLRRHLAAPPARVFRAWTDPQEIARWMGPGEVEVLGAEIDARRGGRYRIAMRTPDGEEHHVGGTYREVVKNKKLVFTWAWRSTPERESLVTVSFQPDGEGTILTLMHEQFFDQGARDRHEHGWAGSLAKLEALVSSLV